MSDEMTVLSERVEKAIRGSLSVPTSWVDDDDYRSATDAVLAVVAPLLAAKDAQIRRLIEERDTWQGRTILAEAELEVGRSDVRRAEAKVARVEAWASLPLLGLDGIEPGSAFYDARVAHNKAVIKVRSALAGDS